MISPSEFIKKMYCDGYAIFPDFIQEDLISRMIDGLQRAYLLCRKIQIKNGVENSEGTAHHLIGQQEVFLDCLARFEDIDPYLERYFGGKYIINSFGGNLLKAESSYANHVHRDQRSFSGDFPLMLNTIIPLDDFTAENGATWLMHRGHEFIYEPTKSEFDDRKFQAIAPAGSLIMFNSNVWHSAGENKTSQPRRSVTPLFSRPFIKQGFDYPRVLGYDYGHAFTPYLQQVLGYNSRIPATLSEWYRSKEKRFYLGDQG